MGQLQRICIIISYVPAPFMSHRRPLISVILGQQTDEAGLEPTKPTMPVVFSEGGLAIIAGSDTTATTLSALSYYLMLHPDMCARLRAEIDAFFPDQAEPIDFTRMVEMSYLHACMLVVQSHSILFNLIILR